MSVTIDNANEKSTHIVALNFFDDDGFAVVPNSINWKLTDSSKNVINSRSSVSVTPSWEIDIVLTGDDLAIIDADLSRFLTVEAPYDSDLGDNLNFNEEYEFNIIDLLNIT